MTSESEPLPSSTKHPVPLVGLVNIFGRVKVHLHARLCSANWNSAIEILLGFDVIIIAPLRMECEIFQGDAKRLKFVAQ